MHSDFFQFLLAGAFGIVAGWLIRHWHGKKSPSPPSAGIVTSPPREALDELMIATQDLLVFQAKKVHDPTQRSLLLLTYQKAYNRAHERTTTVPLQETGKLDVATVRSFCASTGFVLTEDTPHSA